MGFLGGLVVGLILGEWLTFGALALGHMLARKRRELEREEWDRGMDSLLRSLARKQRNRERILEAVRQTIRERQEVAWRN